MHAKRLDIIARYFILHYFLAHIAILGTGTFAWCCGSSLRFWTTWNYPADVGNLRRKWKCQGTIFPSRCSFLKFSHFQKFQTFTYLIFQLLFFVGDNQDPNTQEKLEVESEQNHDIIQENYIESYWNLTRKTVGQLKWKKEFCDSAKYIGMGLSKIMQGNWISRCTAWNLCVNWKLILMNYNLQGPDQAHLDDDVFVDVPNVLEQMRADTRYSNFSHGSCDFDF